MCVYVNLFLDATGNFGGHCKNHELNDLKRQPWKFMIAELYRTDQGTVGLWGPIFLAFTSLGLSSRK